MMIIPNRPFTKEIKGGGAIAQKMAHLTEGWSGFRLGQPVASLSVPTFRRRVHTDKWPIKSGKVPLVPLLTCPL